MRKCIPVFAMGTMLAASILSGDSLRVLGDAYPRAFFFRSAEGMASNPKSNYEQWDKTFSRLMGIEGKVLDEEVPGRSARNIDFFTRFKQRHPDQLVLLHFNGNARDPRYEAKEFFAGHWIYYNGAKILSDLPASGGEIDVRIDAPTLFRINIGRYRNANEDIGICELDASGRPDWNRSEQVKLVSVNAAMKTIRVQRGQYGSAPRAFAAGKAYAAAHVSEGPWGKNSNLLWHYNYSTASPRDAKGRQCAEVVAEDLARHFRARGDLSTFDGLEFDVLRHRVAPERAGRGVDADADGRIDSGMLGGLNTYGIGVIEFCRRLRALLGEKLLLADGMETGNQRAFAILNGIESEGFPDLRDAEFRDWSGGLNRHLFWAVNGRAPIFNYINHKFMERDPAATVPKPAELPFSRHRLAMAASVLTDAAICYSLLPERETGEQIGIWDELRNPGWLGKPRAAAVRMAQRQPELLKGRKALAGKSSGGESGFHLDNVAVQGPDLFVTVTASADPLKGYPSETARMLEVGIGKARTERFMSWVNGREFTSTFYFSDVKPGNVNLEISVEGEEPVRIAKVTAYQHPDAMYREFENGVVLANPSPRPYTFDLSKLFAGQRFRRLKASPAQDKAVNTGEAVAGELKLGPKDAIFLLKTKP